MPHLLHELTRFPVVAEQDEVQPGSKDKVMEALRADVADPDAARHRCLALYGARPSMVVVVWSPCLPLPCGVAMGRLKSCGPVALLRADLCRGRW